MLQKGFTLIELMIVVAIIGILSMFALPAYQDYTKRTYVSEGMALASAAKMQITEGFASSGRWVDNNDAAGLQAPNTITGSGVAGIGVGQGSLFTKTAATADTAATYAAQQGVTASAIFIYYNDKVVGTTGTLTAGATPADGATPAVAAANSVTLSPVTSNSAASIEWICSAAGTGGNGSGGANNTTSATQQVLSKWLPSNCRDAIVNTGA